MTCEAAFAEAKRRTEAGVPSFAYCGDAGWRVFEVGISYAGRTYDQGKKIGWRDGVWALVCIVRYSPVGRRLENPVKRAS